MHTDSTDFQGELNSISRSIWEATGSMSKGNMSHTPPPTEEGTPAEEECVEQDNHRPKESPHFARRAPPRQIHAYLRDKTLRLRKQYFDKGAAMDPSICNSGGKTTQQQSRRVSIRIPSELSERQDTFLRQQRQRREVGQAQAQAQVGGLSATSTPRGQWSDDASLTGCPALELLTCRLRNRLLPLPPFSTPPPAPPKAPQNQQQHITRPCTMQTVLNPSSACDIRTAELRHGKTKGVLTIDDRKLFKHCEVAFNEEETMVEPGGRTFDQDGLTVDQWRRLTVDKEGLVFDQDDARAFLAWKLFSEVEEDSTRTMPRAKENSPEPSEAVERAQESKSTSSSSVVAVVQRNGSLDSVLPRTQLKTKLTTVEMSRGTTTAAAAEMTLPGRQVKDKGEYLRSEVCLLPQSEAESEITAPLPHENGFGESVERSLLDPVILRLKTTLGHLKFESSESTGKGSNEDRTLNPVHMLNDMLVARRVCHEGHAFTEARDADRAVADRILKRAGLSNAPPSPLEAPRTRVMKMIERSRRKRAEYEKECLECPERAEFYSDAMGYFGR